MNSTLDKLAKYHTEWLRMVKSMGGDDFSEDIVQEMYIKIYTKGYNPHLRRPLVQSNPRGSSQKHYLRIFYRTRFDLP